MSLADLSALVSQYGVLAVVCVLLLITGASVLEVSKIKINPWSALGHAIGKRINGQILEELEQIRETQKETRKELKEHIHADEISKVDAARGRILSFNLELLQNLPHTIENFWEILTDIDFYESYCRDHPDYPNNRAVHAIANIKHVYDKRLEKHDFAKE